MERGLFINLHAISRQIVAMPNEFYLLRLIHSVTRAVAAGLVVPAAGVAAGVAVLARFRLRK